MEEIICSIFADPTLWQPEACQLKGWNWFWHMLGTPSFRNGALVVAALITLGVSFWRATIADADKKTSRKQAETNEAGLNIDRFHNGASLLGHDRLSVRQAGIYMLSELAQQNMLEYSDRVQQVLCSFIRDASRVDKSKEEKGEYKYGVDSRKKIDIDAKTAVSELSTLNCKASRLGKLGNTQFDLRDSNLQDANLKGLNLAGSRLDRSSLHLSLCQNLDLSNVTCKEVDFKKAKLKNANFKNVNLSTCHNLTFSQLNEAINVDPDFLEELRLKDIAEKKRSDEAHPDFQNPSFHKPVVPPPSD